MRTTFFRAALLTLSALLLVGGCSTADYDEPSRGGARGRGGDGAWAGREERGGVFDLALPAQWWRDSYVAAPVDLTGEQLAALDKVAGGEEGEIAKLQSDTEVATRELRDLLASDKPSAEAIVAAAQRVRGLRDARFDREAKLLADERLVLSREQWETLQAQLHAQRRPQNRDGRDPRRGGYGGRGGFGGRGGRGPGWPG